MADATPEKTESMEEILQSIKRIMDDDSEKPPVNKEGDVFDLTNVVKENEAMEEVPVVPQSSPIEAIQPMIPANVAPKPDVEMDINLISEQAATAAASSFRKVAAASQKDYSIPHIDSPHLRNGSTVEDLLLEAMRPMLKDWLDTNLPVIVQKIVEKEVKRIVSLHLD